MAELTSLSDIENLIDRIRGITDLFDILDASLEQLDNYIYEYLLEEELPSGWLLERSKNYTDRVMKLISQVINKKKECMEKAYGKEIVQRVGEGNLPGPVKV